MKLVNFQNFYEIPGEYSYVAVNRSGMLMGFVNAPVRDSVIGEWVDSTDGSGGELILFDRWETSVRQVADLTDTKAVTERRMAAGSEKSNAVKNIRKNKH